MHIPSAALNPGLAADTGSVQWDLVGSINLHTHESRRPSSNAWNPRRARNSRDQDPDLHATNHLSHSNLMNNTYKYRLQSETFVRRE